MADPVPTPAPAPAAPRKVFVVGPDGGTYAFSEEQAGEALRLGGRVETQEEARQREVESRQKGNEILTGVEGFLRGRTMGLLDPIESVFVGSKGIAERQEAFPDISTTTEVLGGASGLLPTGGAGAGLARKAFDVVGAPTRGTMALGRVAEKGIGKLVAPLAAKVVAGKIAARGLSVGGGAAVEGALTGLGQFVSESSLGQTDVTAASLLDHVGTGALFGGLAGGVFGGGGEALAIGGAKAAGLVKKAAGRIGDMEDGALKVFAKGSSQALGVDEKAIYDVMRQRGGMDAAQQAPEALAAKMSVARDELDDITDGITANHKGVKKLSFGKGVADKEVSPTVLDDALLGVNPEAPGIYRKMEESLNNARNKGRGGFAGQGQIGQIDDVLQQKLARASDPNVSLAEKIKDVDDFKKTLGAIRSKFSHIDSNTPEILQTKGMLDEFYRLTKDTLEDESVVGKTFSAMQKDVNQNYARQLDLNGAQATSGLVKRHGKRGFLTPEAALKGEIVWRTDPGAMQGFFKGLGEDPNSVALAREIVEERAHRQLATMEAIGRHYDIGEEGIKGLARARKLVSEMDEMIKTGEAAGVLRRQVGQVSRATRGTGINVGSGAIVGGMFGGPIGALAGGIVGALFDPVRAAQQLSTISRLLGSQKLNIVGKVGKYVSKAASTAKRVAPQATVRVQSARTRKDRVEAYKRKLSALSALSADPDAMQDGLISSVRDISEVAPRTAQAMQAQAVRVAGFLHSRMPKPTRPPSPFVNDAWSPADSQLDRYEALEEVALKPSALLDHLHDGTITGEQVAAVRDLHPQVYRQIVDEMTERLSEMQGELPYSERVRLTVLFGVPVEPAAAPEMVATWQAAHAARKAQQAPQGPQGRPTTRRAMEDVDDVADATLTASQRLERKA